MAVGEVDGRPAGDRVAHVAVHADDERAGDENGDRVARAEPVGDVVVGAPLELAEAPEKGVHRPSAGEV